MTVEQKRTDNTPAEVPGLETSSCNLTRACEGLKGPAKDPNRAPARSHSRVRRNESTRLLQVLRGGGGRLADDKGEETTLPVV